MCQRITCAKCNKPTWTGCGAHVEAVMRPIPEAERCKCREQEKPPSGGLLGKLFGKD